MRFIARIICGFFANPIIFFGGLGFPVYLWLEGGMNPLFVLVAWMIIVPLNDKATRWLQHDAALLKPYRPTRRRRPPPEPEPPPPTLVSLTIRRSGTIRAEYPELVGRLPPKLVRLVTEGLVRIEQENRQDADRA